VLYAESLKWCGRIISAEGYQHDPQRIEGLRTMQNPKTADELAEFIYCCRWMSNSIPNFATRVAPLSKLLEEAYTRFGKRTKRSIKSIALSNLSWGTIHMQAFEDLQDTLRNAVKLSYPKQEMEICVHTDASDRFWSAVISQIPLEDLKRPIQEQRY